MEQKMNADYVLSKFQIVENVKKLMLTHGSNAQNVWMNISLIQLILIEFVKDVVIG